MGRTFSAVPHTYLKRGVYYFVSLAIWLAFFPEPSIACSFNCQKYQVTDQPNASLKLLDFSNADDTACQGYSLEPKIVDTQKAVTRYRYPYRSGNFEIFLDSLIAMTNWYISESQRGIVDKSKLVLMKENLLKSANTAADTKLDWSGKGAGPQFATSLLIKAISYQYAILDAEQVLSEVDKKKISDWLQPMFVNQTKKANSLDTKFANANAMIFWGAASKNDGYFIKGKDRFLDLLANSVRTSTRTFTNGVRHNNEIMHQVIPGAEILALNGVTVFDRAFKEVTLNELVSSHARWVFDEGSTPSRTEGDKHEQARSIMRARGFGTHLAWIPVYLSRFTEDRMVIDLRTKLRFTDTQSFYGKHLAIHSGCMYGNNY